MGNRELISMKKSVNKELRDHLRRESILKVSTVVRKHVMDISAREGKRIRPLLFILSYLGYSKMPATGYLTSAVALELIQSFILIHDDIVDRSDLRRGLPSLHKLVAKELSAIRVRFNGNDAAMLIGDIIFALGIKTFLAIDEPAERKNIAMNALLESALYTGCGQVNELWVSMKDIGKVSLEDIYRIYDQKTGHYTFILPLMLGAMLSGEGDSEMKKLASIGKSLGRAFQVQDDLIGLFADEDKSGKSQLSDLRGSKKTILTVIAYQAGSASDRKKIASLLRKDNAGLGDLKAMRGIVERTGARGIALDAARKMVAHARAELAGLRISLKYRELISSLIDEVFPKLSRS